MKTGLRFKRQDTLTYYTIFTKTSDYTDYNINIHLLLTLTNQNPYNFLLLVYIMLQSVSKFDWVHVHVSFIWTMLQGNRMTLRRTKLS